MIHIYVLSLLAWFQAPAPQPSPQGQALRSGCSADDRQLAVVGAEDQVEVRQALAGYAQTCYKVTTQGKSGYLLGETHPDVAAFVHRREEISAASLEAQARYVPPPPPKPATGDKDQPAAPEIPQVFAGFSGRDMNGKPVSLDGMRGRFILVTFWSPASPTSKGQLMSLMSLYKSYSRSDLSAVGISTDPNPNHIRDSLDDIILSWPQIGDTSGLAKRYNADSKAGTTFILDASHRIVASGLKGPALENKVRELLAAPPAKPESSAPPPARDY